MNWGRSGRLLSNPQFWENTFYGAPTRLKEESGNSSHFTTTKSFKELKAWIKFESFKR